MLDTWGMLIGSWGAFLGGLIAAISASAAWRTLGRIEGRVERWNDRLRDHSEKIDSNTADIARLVQRWNSVENVMMRVDKALGDMNGELDSE